MSEFKHCFAPVVNAQTRILVLGSLPGDASLAVSQYYAHPRNAFWPIVAALTGKPLDTLPYGERLQGLLACGIGLWDVVGKAQRRGSLDAAVRDVQRNDLASLLVSLPALEVLAFNGALAYKTALREPGVYVPALALPSTSPAYTVAFADKLAAWRVLQPYLGV
ncbi:DNA-deoxyinosine glycosylase [Craterilacuibacter sinensis]|uniref:DNA-deoxyinosine glycosylase n=1 Tax=Craterilacuibacter sinensis TaxID=2686017 RepID=A0A845BKP3_9NEIS|nr:DNA-deoxyinosine glycosylase [Craterilacuibacter sinensis]MXR36905.1 DNA-deoxyinosine glycosylase [Craterilacuibacter sinensis]